MSVYKVPQDVEADDKLLGPFNFRQFIYLIIVALMILFGVFLFQIFPGLIIIPAPFVVFFGALALPLKRDQPMETYLAAIVSFHIKPTKRLWQPDGVEHLIQISAPLTTDKPALKGIAHEEAAKRLSYLADIVDTGGWAIKHSVAPDTLIKDDVRNEADATSDIFDDNRVANNIDALLENRNAQRKQQILQNLNTARDLADYTSYNAEQIQAQTYQAGTDYQYFDTEPAPTLEQVQSFAAPMPTVATPTAQQFSPNYTAQSEEPTLQYNPYPEAIHQSVISPKGQAAPAPNYQQNYYPQESGQAYQPYYQQPPEPQYQPVAPAPIQPTLPQPQPMSEEMKKLVSEGKDLSVETLARQANKIKTQELQTSQQNEEEVIISLR